jgi:KTSC domain
MAMTNYPVASSAIANIGYDDETGDCNVTFTDGTQYVLDSPVPGIEMERWLNSDSKGGYWNANMRGRY